MMLSAGLSAICVCNLVAANGHISSTQLAASGVGPSNTEVETIAIVLH